MAAGRRTRLRQLLAVVQYAVVLTGLIFLVLTVLSLPLGLGFVGVKIGLFVVGVMTLGYGTYLAWPSSPEDLQPEDTDVVEPDPWFQRFVTGLPPLVWYPVHPEAAVPDWVKVYTATALIFLTSYLMESVFGVVA